MLNGKGPPVTPDEIGDFLKAISNERNQHDVLNQLVVALWRIVVGMMEILDRLAGKNAS